MQIIIQMFREASGFEIILNEVLIICLLNTIQDKNMMVKVQEQMTENMTWEEVRNIIIKIDNASRLSDVYKQNKNRMWAQGVQSKTCRACEIKRHMVAACVVLKEKLYCKHCDIKSSHNTSACLKKQKEDKERKKGSNTGKMEKTRKARHT